MLLAELLAIQKGDNGEHKCSKELDFAVFLIYSFQ